MKKAFILPSLIVLLLPFISHAQGLQGWIGSVNGFLSGVIIPFLLGIAFLIFVYNAFRFFILEGSNQDGRKKAKALATYSILAFVLIIVFFGIVNLLISTSDLGGEDQPESDYVELMGG